VRFDPSHLGWLILITRMHRTSIAELTDAEAIEFGPLTKAVSVALGDITGCPKTYLTQFAEHPDHQHVHIHIVARTEELNPNHRGPFVFAELGANEGSRVPEHKLNDHANQLAAHPTLAAYR
jgi:diadenosine tetraphosphate (Ap4A) HIT family hydrolase